MKKNILMLALLASAALNASADNYNYLTVQKQDGTEQSFTAQGLTITFANGNMVATQDGQTTTLALSELNKMFFSQEPTGIEDVSISEPAGEASGAVYDLSGRKVTSAPVSSSTPSLLKKGIYIVNGKKIVVK